MVYATTDVCHEKCLSAFSVWTFCITINNANDVDKLFSTIHRQVRDFQTVDFETKSDLEHYRTARNG